jgi:hypothetical protein
VPEQRRRALCLECPPQAIETSDAVGVRCLGLEIDQDADKRVPLTPCRDVVWRDS